MVATSHLEIKGASEHEPIERGAGMRALNSVIYEASRS